MTKLKLQNGIGARCSVIARFLHPRRLIKERYPYYTFDKRIGGLLVARREQKQVNHRIQQCLVFQHDDFNDQELYAVERYGRVTEEGPSDSFFIEDEEVPDLDTRARNDEGLNALESLPAISGQLVDDIARLRRDGFSVDDDMDPAPENIPREEGESKTEDELLYFAWNSRTTCNRRSDSLGEEKPRLLKSPEADTRIGYFCLCFPMVWLKTVFIPATNKAMNGKDVTIGEIMRYLGMWLLMSTQAKCSVREYFSTAPIDPYSNGALFHLNEIMSWNRFNSITQALRFTDEPPPSYKDGFYQVRQLINAFNDHMISIFSAGWISCLDESMSVWTRRWSCPGWMWVPRKPHPKGNEYHSICDCLSGIMYGLEIVEGKDAPKERKKEFDEKGKTVALLLRLCKPIFATGKVVILDSGFCVLAAIISLKQFGVFASAMIKKRRYWPKGVPCEDIISHFEHKHVGMSERLPGMFEGMKFDIFAHKEPDYVTMFMSTYGACITKPNQKDSPRSWLENGMVMTSVFRYTEVPANHYRYRGAVDAHNRWRHDGGANQGLSIEETWDTKRWENRVFAFIVAVVEVNTFLAMKFFRGIDEDFLSFRKKISKGAHSQQY